MLNQFGNCPLALLHTGDRRWRTSQSTVHLAEIIIPEVERNRSLKLRQAIAECVSEP
jgi:hypothetical protein